MEKVNNISPYVYPLLVEGSKHTFLGKKRQATTSKTPEESKNILKTLTEVICEYFSIEPELVRTKKRNKEIVNVRHWMFYIAVTYYGFGTSSVGRYLGYNHGSAHSAVKKIKGYIEVEKGSQQVELELLKTIRTKLPK